MPVIKSFAFCLEIQYAKSEIEKMNSFKAKIKNWSMGELQEWLSINGSQPQFINHLG